MNKETVDYINGRLDKEEDDRHKALEGANVRILLLEENSIKRSIFTWAFGILITVSIVVFSGMYSNIKSMDGELSAYQNEVFKITSEMNKNIAVIQTELVHLTHELKQLNLIEE